MDQDVSKKLDHIEELVENLAAATAKGFAAVDERFEKIDERFEKLEQKVEKLDQKIDGVEERLTSRIDGLGRAVDAGYGRQGALEARISKVETELHL
jgi:predicted  nucleic acid-binding Zn-ribbon protein